MALGSAVFDTVSEEVLEGIVKEAALPPRGYNQLPTSGVLSYQDGEGEEQLIPYGLGDLKVGHVPYIMLLVGTAGPVRNACLECGPVPHIHVSCFRSYADQDSLRVFEGLCGACGFFCVLPARPEDMPSLSGGYAIIPLLISVLAAPLSKNVLCMSSC